MTEERDEREKLPVESKDPSEGLTEDTSSQTIWMRLFFMVVVVFLYSVSRFVVAAVIVIQFFCVLLTDEPNDNLKRFGRQLATFIFQIIRYLTFNTEQRPFPFDLEWPEDR